jgi:CheY-like chemotaxis protein
MRLHSSCIVWWPILPEEKQKMLDRLHHSDDALVGRKCWLWTTTCATSLPSAAFIERRGMTVIDGRHRREAIAMLESTPDIAIVLMDIMMPEMDGYETMQVIRQNASFRRLPIIALTAKAMKGDREKCLEAGASEYLAKPVNTEQLLSSLRMWLH